MLDHLIANVASDPLEQFVVDKYVPLFNIGGQSINLNEAGLYMIGIVAGICLLLALAASRRELVPNRLQSLGEMSYEFVAGMIRDVNGPEGMRFFPFVFSIFMFVLFANLVGMFPYFHTVTSHIIVTFTLAMVAISVVIIAGVMNHGLKFLKIFMPSGLPWPVYILVIPIEIFSFLSRPLSLGMRLFANMLAGHIALKIFAMFVPMMAGLGFLGVVGAVAPFFMTVAITALEFLVSFLQAYVFAILTCVYLNDALHPGH